MTGGLSVITKDDLLSYNRAVNAINQNQRNNNINSVGAIPPPAGDGTISQNPYSEDDSGDIELEF